MCFYKLQIYAARNSIRKGEQLRHWLIQNKWFDSGLD